MEGINKGEMASLGDIRRAKVVTFDKGQRFKAKESFSPGRCAHIAPVQKGSTLVYSELGDCEMELHLVSEHLSSGTVKKLRVLSLMEIRKYLEEIV